jgi:hypothetical protein
MKSVVFFMTLASAAWGQSNSGLKARELFYTPPPDASAQAAKPPEQAKPAPAKQVSAAKSTPKQTTAKSSSKPAATSPSTASAPATHVVQAAVPLGLRYAVLKRDAAGKYAEVDPDTNFRSGDRIRMQIDANTTGYLYVVMQGSSGNWRLLFPSSEVAGGSNLVQKGQSLQIPGGQGQFVFDEQSGTEKLFLILTRQPETDLDKLIYSMRGQSPANSSPERMLMAQASLGDDVVNHLRSEVQARDLVFEKVDTASAAPPAAAPATGTTPDGSARIEKAAYVVNPSTAPDARLVVDISLKHR